VKIVDEFSVELTSIKETALKLVKYFYIKIVSKPTTTKRDNTSNCL